MLFSVAITDSTLMQNPFGFRETFRYPDLRSLVFRSNKVHPEWPESTANA